MRFRIFAVGSVLALALAGVASSALAKDAQGNSKQAKAKESKPKENKASEDKAKAPEHVVVIDLAGHRQVVGDYYSRATLPPGLAKREALPPGLQKQMIEKGHLPPGLEGHFYPIPADLASRLPPIPIYDRRYFAGRDLVVVDTRTNTLAAIIRDILK